MHNLSTLMWHQTDTIDYIYIHSGELVLVTEQKEIPLRAGDALVLRGIRHAWSNRSDTLCVMACASVSAR
ncbi:MAG TPA: cupin domain-containing protein [bacterium]